MRELVCLGSVPYVDERTGVFGVSTICGWENWCVWGLYHMWMRELVCLGSVPYVDERTGVFGVCTICG